MNVIIMRGLPGSGKDTYIKNNAKAFPAEPVICSADDYFVNNGIYKFDPRGLTMAHHNCMSLFLRSLAEKKPLIIVNNTNCELWEFDNYITAAELAGYEWMIVDLYDGIQTNEELARRNIHGVPEQGIVNMRQRWMKLRKAREGGIEIFPQTGTGMRDYLEYVLTFY